MARPTDPRGELLHVELAIAGLEASFAMRGSAGWKEWVSVLEKQRDSLMEQLTTVDAEHLLSLQERVKTVTFLANLSRPPSEAVLENLRKQREGLLKRIHQLQNADLLRQPASNEVTA